MRVTPVTPMQARVIEPDRLKLQIKPEKLALEQKLKAYDPAINCRELMRHEPVGAEFEAR